MANLEFVAVGILKENGVIAGGVFDAQLRSFDVFRARLAKHVGNLIYGFTTRRPERDPVRVRLMIGVLFESEEIDADAVLSLEKSPFLAALVDAKSDRWQNLGVKLLGGFAVLYPQIDVVEKARAHA